jgi:hypothetical protein
MLHGQGRTGCPRTGSRAVVPENLQCTGVPLPLMKVRVCAHAHVNSGVYLWFVFDARATRARVWWLCFCLWRPRLPRTKLG